MKKLIFEQTQDIHQYSLAVNEGMTVVNEIVNEFNKLPLKKVTDPAQIEPLINDCEGFAATMLPESTPVKMFGVTLKPAKIVELMDLNFTDLKKKIAEAKAMHYNFGKVAQFIEVAKYGKGFFEVDPAKLAARLEGFRHYAQTDKELKLHEAYTELIAAFEKMGAIVGTRRLIQTPANRLFSFQNDQITGINPHFWDEVKNI